MTLPVLITGARGYIGGRLARELEQEGVRVLRGTRDRAVIGRPDDTPWMWVDPLDPECKLVEGLRGVGAIVHLAAANEWRSAADPEAAMLETAGGTRRLVEAAIEAAVDSFLFFSTIHVYGSPLAGDLNEDARPRPAHPYAVTHLAAETYVECAIERRRIGGAIVRLSNAIGSPATIDVDRWTLLGNDMVRQAVTTGSIAVRTPDQWRDFVVIEDVVRAARILLRSPLRSDAIVNVGSGRAMLVIDVATAIADIVGRETGRHVEIVAPSIMGSGDPPFRFALDRLSGLGYLPSGADAFEREVGATARLVLRGQTARTSR